MKKCVMLLLVVSVLGFSYGLDPSFSLGLGWSYQKPDDYDGSHFLGFGIGTTVPYSRYVGLTAGLFWVNFDLSEEATILGLSSRIGLIEMVPSKYVSPFFTQSIVLDHISSGGISYTTFGFGLGIGIEFLSSGYVRPYISGDFAYANSSLDGMSSSMIGFGAGAGVRFSWVK